MAGLLDCELLAVVESQVPPGDVTSVTAFRPGYRESKGGELVHLI